ncbi:MAG TPA: NADH-quinone oxidoreductase subunit C [Candidatus Sulfopaludibacter sp.]|nr:NADH-quinone oxidoreductase subunit C [Candidatus Sulfopaludibacter sp.]
MNALDEILAGGGAVFPYAPDFRPGEIYVDLAGPDAREAAAYLRSAGCRHAALFAEDRRAEEYRDCLYYVFEHREDRRYLLLRAPIDASEPAFPSIAAEVPALNWQEREIQDWFGLEAVGHPNPRRVALHDNWPDVHPLRKDFPFDAVLPPFEGEQHIYRPTVGEGVFQIPVGPVHAGIIEPGHFSFSVAGEPILYLQLRMFYVHKGTEKLFEQLPAQRAVFLAESVSGDSSFSHATAFCQAVERIAEVEIPEAALWLRTILLELERIYNHTADIGAIATDVGFGIANAHASRLRELVLGINEDLTGSRLLRGVVCPGGIRRPCGRDPVVRAMEALGRFERDFDTLTGLIESSDSTRDRLERTGFLAPDKARDLGIVGVGGRASGQDLDVRRDHPYAAYGALRIDVPVYQEGDVLRRMQVRIDEVRHSLGLIRAALPSLDPGRAVRVRMPDLPPDRYALGSVEGWRGEILYWVRTGDWNRIARCKVKDPSVNNWPAVVEAVQGNIVPDFPVINKSFNLSYSGTDR